MKNNKTSKKFKDITIIISVFLVFVISALITYKDDGLLIWEKVFNTFNLTDEPAEEQNYKMKVHFLDVGRADCAYIECGKTNILIDSGDCSSQNVVEYLKRHNVNKFDLVIVSHPHRDHIGQMYDVIDNFEIDCFMMSEVPESIIPTSYTYRRMLESLNKKSVNVKTAKPKDRLIFNEPDNKLVIDILGPLNKYENINNNSIVAKITYGNDSFLFVGDAEKESELDLIDKYDLRAEVLKVGHHGSKTSSCIEFLSTVKPTYAVVSAGPDKFNLPKKEVLDRIAGLGIKIFRTDVMGNITFLSNGNGVKIITEKESA